jgi:hypothetical protein
MKNNKNELFLSPKLSKTLLEENLIDNTWNSFWNYYKFFESSDYELILQNDCIIDVMPFEKFPAVSIMDAFRIMPDTYNWNQILRYKVGNMYYTSVQYFDDKNKEYYLKKTLFEWYNEIEVIEKMITLLIEEKKLKPIKLYI